MARREVRREERAVEQAELVAQREERRDERYERRGFRTLEELAAGRESLRQEELEVAVRMRALPSLAQLDPAELNRIRGVHLLVQELLECPTLHGAEVAI